MKIVFVLIILAVCAFSWSLIEAQLFRVKKIKLENHKIKGSLNIVFISDIHFGKFNNYNRLEKIVKKMNALKPDIVLIGGDYLDFERKSKFNKRVVDNLFEDLKGITSKYGVFTVLGNHDYYLGRKLDYMLEKMKNNNIMVLKNESFKLKLDGNYAAIHGMDDLQEGTVHTGNLKLEKDGLNIVLVHNPDFYEDYDMEFDLGFSGHTHGGQVNFFGLYAPSTESKYGQKYIRRVNKKGKGIIFTTKGIGCITLPIRFFAMPEILQIYIN